MVSVGFNYSSIKAAGNDKSALMTHLQDTLQLNSYQVDSDKEYVTVGYGQVEKSQATGNITSVCSEGLDSMPGETVLSSLQGKVAMLIINESDEEVSIQIRRYNTFL